MADNTSFQLTRDQEQAVLLYGRKAQELLINQFSMRSMLEEIDRQYMREKNWTAEQWRARLANRAGDADKIQDATVPIVMPQVEAALGYLTNVFLTGYPIFGIAADPANEDAALQMETIIAENAQTTGWARELLMFFRDGLKYNLHAVELEWTQRTVGQLDTDISAPNGVKPKQGLWKGNAVKRMDLYNTFFDPRVHPAQIHLKGEFAGYAELYSRTQFKQYCNDLYGQVSPGVIEKALKSSPAGGVQISGMTPYAYYMPLINPAPTVNKNNLYIFDWLAWAANTASNRNLEYSNVYVVYKVYARIIPADFGMNVPAKNTPQVWKFIIVNGEVVLYAERQSNVHNYLPIFFGQPIEDGLDFQTKSFATNVQDLQEVATAMLHGYIASKRRLVTDRVLFDPLRVRQKDIESPNPSAKIPVRPSAFGKNVAEAVYQFPYHDEQAQSLLQGVQTINGFANLVNGQNPAQQGQFVKGNKTLEEYNDTMGHGNVRNQMMAIMTENQVFTPLKEAIKLNILQFQEDGDKYNQQKSQTVPISVDTLRQAAIQFKVSDGIMPEEKLMSSDEFMTALQVLGSSQQIASGYNISPLFTYIMKMRGADLTPFEKPQAQVQYEQQMAAWQEAAAQAAKAGSAFSTPMPQPPQTPPAQAATTPPGGQPSNIAAPSTQQTPQMAAMQQTQGNPPAASVAG